MEVIKFDRIVSVNSEIQGHNAQNILEGEISPNKNWMCEKGTDKAVVILQLERAAILTSIHVGNAHSAFVEVLVGKAANSSDQYESLIPMSTFMNPQESKTGSNPNRTRFFNKSDFNEANANKAWDRIKVVCSQPFNKHVAYGLCFVKVHGEKEKKKVEATTAEKNSEEEDIQIGSFFKKKRQSDGDKPLSVSEQIKEAEKESSLAKHTPISITKVSAKMSEKQEKKPKKPIGDKVDEPPEKRKKKEEEKTPKKRKVEEKTKEKKEQEIVKRKKKRRKPFENLMEDVVFVISGFQNPLRGNIRSLALEMGAKYSADWDSRCTHLVCAFENTPKFNQVKGKGKIVKKDWVEKCHEDRKRYPWRRFALDKSDSKKPESEEEIEAEEESEQEEVTDEPSSSHQKSDFEDEKKTKFSDAEDYDALTDEDNKEKTKVDTSDYPMPYLPELFSLKTFYLDPDLQNKSILERYIVAYNGILTETFSNDVEFYITERGGALLEVFRNKAPKLVAVKPSWIWETNARQQVVPADPHLVK